jgi:hypothetical protein
MTLDPVFLSRLQWVCVIAWHILLPAFTVGLASYIAVLEGLFFFRREDVWLRTSRFWIRIFAVSFAMGVVSGIVMPFQFGTNWSRFSDAVANVVSPMMAYEGLMAFFMEAAFLLNTSLWPKISTALGAFFRCVHGRDRHAFFVFLDPFGEQLDADAGGLHRCGFAFRVMVGIGLVCWRWWPQEWTTVRNGLVPAPLPMDSSAWLRGGARRMDHYRGRPAALHRVRIDANGGICFAVPNRVRRAFVAPRLCCHLSLNVPSGTRGNGTVSEAGPDRGCRDTHTGRGAATSGTF